VAKFNPAPMQFKACFGAYNHALFSIQELIKKGSPKQGYNICSQAAFWSAIHHFSPYFDTGETENQI